MLHHTILKMPKANSFNNTFYSEKISHDIKCFACGSLSYKNKKTQTKITKDGNICHEITIVCNSCNKLTQINPHKEKYSFWGLLRYK